MSEFVSIKDCCDFIRNSENVAILSHKSPDGDTIGTAYGLKGILISLGKRAKVLCSDPIPKKYSYFTDKIVCDENFEPETVISVDIADTGLFGEGIQKYADRVDLAIDHHRTHKAFARKVYVDADAPAAAEIMYTILHEMDIKPDVNTANALFTGICTDTGGFKYEGTSPYTHRAAAALMEFGAESAKINKLMFDTKSKAKLNLEMRVLGNLRYYFDGKCAVTAIFENDLRESGALPEDVEGIASIPTSIEGVELGITIKERNGGFKVSMRSARYVNVAELCGQFGGGGHIRAAGCFIDKDCDETVKLILEAAQKYI